MIKIEAPFTKDKLDKAQDAFSKTRKTQNFEQEKNEETVLGADHREVLDARPRLDEHT